MSPLQITIIGAGAVIYAAGFVIAAEWTRRDNEDTHRWTPDTAKPSPFRHALWWPIWAGGTLAVLAFMGCWEAVRDWRRERRRLGR